MTEDLVNHPVHYEKHTITLEPIDLLETLPFAVGNCLKYIFRAKDKDSELLDLKKALFYHKRVNEVWAKSDRLNGPLECLHELSVLRFSDVEILQRFGNNISRSFDSREEITAGSAWFELGKALKRRIMKLEDEAEEE